MPDWGTRDAVLLVLLVTEVSLCSPDLELATKTKLASGPQKPDNLCLPSTGITTLSILRPPMLGIYCDKNTLPKENDTTISKMLS